MNLKYLASVFVLLLWSPGCRETESRQPAPAQQNLERTRSLEDIFTKETTLYYRGFEVTKLHKTVNVEGLKTEVSYAVLKKLPGK